MDIDSPREITPLWHFNPSCEVKIENNSIVTNNAGKGNLRITPVSKIPWKVNLVKGQEKPHIQGWYSEYYNKKKTNYCALYTSKIQKSSTLAWVLLPVMDKIPNVKTEVLPSPEGVFRMRIIVPDISPIEIAVRISGEGGVSLSDGYVLDGSCAIIQKGKTPLVAEGMIMDKTGKIVGKSFMDILHESIVR